MPDCVGEWDHHRYGRSSKQFLPRSWRSKRDGLSPYLRTSGVRGLTPLHRDGRRGVAHALARSLPVSAPATVPREGSGSGAAANGLGTVRSCERVETVKLLVAPLPTSTSGPPRPITCVGRRLPNPSPDHAPGRGHSSNRSRVGSSTPRGLLPIISGLGAQSPPRPTSPGVPGPGRSRSTARVQSDERLNKSGSNALRSPDGPGARIRPGPGESGEISTTS